MKKFSVRKLETLRTTAALYAGGCGGGGGGWIGGGGPFNTIVEP
jgi:hypothetical protein